MTKGTRNQMMFIWNPIKGIFVIAIAEVVDAFVFNEVAHFNQCFKRTIGMPATQFRKQQIGE